MQDEPAGSGHRAVADQRGDEHPHFGRERRRLGVVQLDHDEGMSHFTAFELTDWGILFNAVLIVTLISMMMLSLMPLPILFMLAVGLGVLVNFPSVKDQKEVIVVVPEEVARV